MGYFKREAMVADQIAARGVTNLRVLQAMRDVPREAFVPEDLAEFAYADAPLDIGKRQTISQPYIVARMLELAAIGADDQVLEVGAGSGYAAAILSRLARRVFAIELIGTLAYRARERLAMLGYDNVEIFHRDGSMGLPERAPFDAIIVSAAAAEPPRALCDQLAVGGRMVIPIRTRRRQYLTRIVRTDTETLNTCAFERVSFVPLIAADR